MVASARCGCGCGCLATVITLGVSVAVELSLLPVGHCSMGVGGTTSGPRRFFTGVSCSTADLRMVCCSSAFTSIAGHATSETLRHKCVSSGDELSLRRICLLQLLLRWHLLLLLLPPLLLPPPPPPPRASALSGPIAPGCGPAVEDNE